MDRRSYEEAYEREPLESSHVPYDNSHQFSTSQPSYESYRPDPAYYDTLPRHHPNSHSWSGAKDDGTFAGPNDDAPVPVPPRHGRLSYYKEKDSIHRGDDMKHSRQPPQCTVTPGADNFGESASGGMVGIAQSVAERNTRQSDIESSRTISRLPPPPSQLQYPDAPQHRYPPHGQRGTGLEANYNNSHSDLDRYSHSSFTPSGTLASASSHSPARRPHNFTGGDTYTDDPYQRNSGILRNGGDRLGIVEPHEIEDDGDDGLDYSRNSQRNSMLSVARSGRGFRVVNGAATTVGGAPATSGVSGGLLGRNGRHGNSTEYDPNTGNEKSSGWFSRQKSGSKKWKWIIIALIFLVIAGAIIGGVVGSLISGRKSDGQIQGQSAKDDSDKNGDLSIDSAEIKGLLNNPKFHKVFPGIDYTPINAQYPDCLHNPPSQNNVTRDVAVLSQLTNKIRLYGTDCNQTEMVIHAIKQLKMTSDIKIWMGVWQNDNATTNSRQLQQMWNILDEYGQDPFEGIIVANEILFRKEMSITDLGEILGNVRTNLTDKNINLPVATSDLGNDWTSALAQDSEYIMANVHPFFSGTPASEAASWTYTFWDTFDGGFFKADKSKNVISETGWPTAGGTNCGDKPYPCSDGALAGVDELNQFMKDWVCTALQNGTNYFWFEAFDEPWKVRYNEQGKAWEDQWGLMDVNRVLKKGVQIPSCNGQTVS